jgi:hypothetical protein
MPCYRAPHVPSQLTSQPSVGILSNMRAELLLDERHQLSGDSFVRLKIWCVPTTVRGSRHDLKYSLALIAGGECVMRYDNEAGKGDHRHVGLDESAYPFTSPERLLADFWDDVDRWRTR